MSVLNPSCATKKCSGFYLGHAFSSLSSTLSPKVIYLLRNSKTMIQKLYGELSQTQYDSARLKQASLSITLQLDSPSRLAVVT